jgi:hypothetical protein
MPPTWEELLAIEPELRSFELDAEQAGRNGCSWWLPWLYHFSLFVGVLAKLRKAAGDGARAVVLDHLETVYRRNAVSQDRPRRDSRAQHNLRAPYHPERPDCRVARQRAQTRVPWSGPGGTGPRHPAAVEGPGQRRQG